MGGGAADGEGLVFSSSGLRDVRAFGGRRLGTRGR